ncbi:MAG TPA: polysaccharide lyase family 1 protein [Micromonosporaceae bacterium]|nr:polysaccharide lyase family 1 protein [Micromonosporaceae bacterium]
MRMQTRTFIAAGAVAGLAAATVVTPAEAATTTPSPRALAVARQVLPAQDGWAAAGGGTTGGSAAEAAHITVAHNRSELIAALGGNNATNARNATPKIVLVDGLIDANVDDANMPLRCGDYAAPGYSLQQFLEAYDPAGPWGRVAPSGPLEDARVASARNQSARVNINIGANTTILGVNGARITGANLLIQGVSNVIIRNLTLTDAHDCFPSWSPTDGAAGNWNSLYDTLSVIGSTNVWVDHNQFSDGQNDDDAQPVYFGRPYQVHDGLLDITRAADLVTVSYNHMHDHDKAMLIGSSNTSVADVGRLRVTIHHNRFANLGQRVPRVRFGQVDVYNNYYVATDEDTFQYSWGAGVASSIYAENNFFLRSADIPLDAFVYDWSVPTNPARGAVTELGTKVRVGTGRIRDVSLVEAYNATHEPDLGPVTGWVPTLRPGIVTPTAAVPTVVMARAGTGRLGV